MPASWLCRSSHTGGAPRGTRFRGCSSGGPRPRSIAATDIARVGRLILLTPQVGGARVTMFLDEDLGSDVLGCGVMARFGPYYTELMPDCGCDGCFEAYSELSERLVEDLE